MKSNLFVVAKEGWKFIGYAVVAVFIFSILDLGLLEFFSFMAIVFFIFVFRNPEREAPPFQSDSVVSPVDGVVLSMEELTNSEYAYKITIDSNYLNVSLLRAPLSASIKSLNIKKGARLQKNSELLKKINSQTEIVFEDYQANKLKVKHILKRSFDETRLDLIENQELRQGERYGVMLNGMTVIYLPQNFRLNITVGNELKASQSLIGYFSS
jgi:phosphatidylserine decarboxylase